MIITNDFPPRVGGIESFVADVVELLDRDVVVYTSSAAGSAAVDSSLRIEVVRAGRVLLPTPAATRLAISILQRSGAHNVIFGAAAPLGLMAGPLRRAGARQIVAISHGHEVWWATLPVAGSLLRRLGDDADHVTTISEYTEARIAPALSPAARERMLRLPPPVDTTIFRPTSRSGGGARPRVIAVGRLVRQKGFTTLLHSWRRVLDGWPPASKPPELVLVGDGPQGRRLERLAADLKLTSTVQMTGRLARSEVVAELGRADVFALPVRTRLAGLNPEGLGLAAIEAAACGLPVIVGSSGGAPETVLDGVTGFVVGSLDQQQLASRITLLLGDLDRAKAMGAAGRRFVTDAFGFERARQTMHSALRLP